MLCLLTRYPAGRVLQTIAALGMDAEAIVPLLGTSADDETRRESRGVPRVLGYAEFAEALDPRMGPNQAPVEGSRPRKQV